MKKIILGETGIEVTELCFGALPIGPLQKNVSVNEGAEVIAHALENGVNFIDTAHVYKTYPHIRAAMDKTGIRPVISSKTLAVDYDDAEKHIEAALTELNLDKIDIFLIHAARSGRSVLEDRRGALECLIEYKRRGVIRAIGISTHDVSVAELAAGSTEIDIVYPLINKAGMGILSGDRAGMEHSLRLCLDNGKGVYLMKVLAGGNLIPDYLAAMDYARSVSRGRAAVSVGMISKREVDINTGYFNGDDISELLTGENAVKKRFFIPKSLCRACGACIETCHSQAIEIIDGTAVIDYNRCLTCGYCVGNCPQFAIRML